MKNILRENMRRFKTKNLNENVYEQFLTIDYYGIVNDIEDLKLVRPNSIDSYVDREQVNSIADQLIEAWEEFLNKTLAKDSEKIDIETLGAKFEFGDYYPENLPSLQGPPGKPSLKQALIGVLEKNTKLKTDVEPTAFRG